MGFGEIVLLMVIAFVLVLIAMISFLVVWSAVKAQANEDLAEKIEGIMDRQWDKMMDRYKEFIKGITQA